MGGTLKYNREIIKSAEGRSLFERWKKFHKKPCSPEFADFDRFYEWAMANGFTLNSFMVRNDEDAPYCAENCRWVIGCNYYRNAVHKMGISWAQNWNKTVNVIRKYYGMNTVEEAALERKKEQGEEDG